MKRISAALVLSLLAGCSDDAAGESAWRYTGPVTAFDSVEQTPVEEFGGKSVVHKATIDISAPTTVGVHGNEIIADGNTYDLDGTLQQSGYADLANAMLAGDEVVTLSLNGYNLGVIVEPLERDGTSRVYELASTIATPTLTYYLEARHSIVLLYDGVETQGDDSSAYVLQRFEFSVADGEILNADEITLVESTMIMDGDTMIGRGFSGDHEGPVHAGDHVYIGGAYGYSSCCHIPEAYSGPVATPRAKSMSTGGVFKLRADDLSVVWQKELQLEGVPREPGVDDASESPVSRPVVDPSGNVYLFAAATIEPQPDVASAFEVIKLSPDGDVDWARRWTSSAIGAVVWRPQASPTGGAVFGVGSHIVGMDPDGTFQWALVADTLFLHLLADGTPVFLEPGGTTLNVSVIE